jgi:hypothetical protein
LTALKLSFSETSWFFGLTTPTVKAFLSLVNAADIGEPGADYTLSGWFGGAGAEGDAAALTARFLNESGAVLDSDAVGDVSPDDRSNTTGLLRREVRGTFPAGTRFVEFTLTSQVDSGGMTGVPIISPSC